MAQGPGRLKSGRERHTSQGGAGRPSTKRSLSAESRPYTETYRQTSGHPYTPATSGDVEAAQLVAWRRPGSSSDGSFHPASIGAKTKPSNGHGGPEMGIKSIEMENSSVIQTVEIFKRPGQTLGFYIREGNGMDRQEGVFISRIQIGTVAESNGLLHVGDEILTVNNVEVGKMSLDDVVILMSIPRKLILKVRSKKNCNKKNASCPSLAITEKEDPPVVVVKKGHVRASSDTQLEMTEKLPDMFDQPYSSSAPQSDDFLSKRFQRQERPTSSQYASIFISPHKAEAKLITGDDLNDSENSSEGSLPRSIDSGSREHYSGHRGYSSSSVGIPDDPRDGYLVPSSLGAYPLTQSESLDREYNRILQSDRKFIPTHQRSPSKGSTMPHSVSGGGGRPLYYQPEPDQRGGFPSDAYSSPIYDYLGYRGYNDGGRRYQGGGFREMIHSRARYGTTKAPRSRSPECYNSDSEVIYTHPRGGATQQAAVDARGFASDYETYAGAMSDDNDPVYAVPKQISASSSTELQQLLRRFNSLSHELQQEQSKLQKQLSTRSERGGDSRERERPGAVGFSRPEGYCSDDYGTIYSSNSSSYVTKSLSPVPMRKVTSSSTATQTPSHANKQLIRKHSADCLLSYKTYQMEDPYAGVEPPPQEPRYASVSPHMHSSSKGPLKGVSPTATTSTSTSDATEGTKSIDTNGKTITRTSASRFKDLQLAKRPLQIPYGEFDCYKVDLRKRAEYTRVTGYDGILSVHVLCGQGLKSTKMTLRDLYCVVSIDSLNKARTMIRTGAVNFDWDESFDIDLENAKDVSFLIYNWDPNYKHRLCFHGSILLPGFLEPVRKKNIALKMEPKGLLYLTIVYREPRDILQRSPAVRKEGLFGVDLDAVIKREGSNLGAPLLVVKCIAEVERRGLEVVGIYRLCGSARRKAQLREVFEKNPASVDLTPENVSDIHVVTGVLKDYLRELPEPLVTNALYQMLLDALSVRLPSDPDGSAKLMLSILECLPKANQDTMSMVLNHLHKIANTSDKNKMSLEQLAVCLGPVLLCPSPGSAEPPALEFKKHIEVLKYLLEIWPDRNETVSPKKKMFLGQLAVCLGPVLLCPSPGSAEPPALESSRNTSRCSSTCSRSGPTETIGRNKRPAPPPPSLSTPR